MRRRWARCTYPFGDKVLVADGDVGVGLSGGGGSGRVHAERFLEGHVEVRHGAELVEVQRRALVGQQVRQLLKQLLVHLGVLRHEEHRVGQRVGCGLMARKEERVGLVPDLRNRLVSSCLSLCVRACVTSSSVRA